MDIKTFKTKHKFGGVVDFFVKVSIFLGGWPGKPVIYIKTPIPILLKQQIFDAILNLHNKVPAIKSYEVKVYESGGIIDCGLHLIFVGEDLFNLAKVIWRARKVLTRGNEIYNSDELYIKFKDDHEYGMRRLAEIQRQEINLGKLLDTYSFTVGPFGLKKQKHRTL